MNVAIDIPAWLAMTLMSAISLTSVFNLVSFVLQVKIKRLQLEIDEMKRQR